MTEIEKWVEDHEAEMVSDICQLVRIPSISQRTQDGEAPFGKPCRDAMEKALEIGRNMGFEAFNHENYCGTLLWKGESEEEIGIFGHTDVVPAGSGWSYEPFTPVVKDGLIIGRGSSDNKGSLVAALYGIKYLKDTGYKPTKSIRFFLGCSEEKGMEDVQYYVSHYREPEFSLVPDVMFPVCNGEKGIMELDACCEKKSRVLKSFQSGIMSNAVPADAKAVLILSKEEAEKVKARGRESGVCVQEKEEGCLEIHMKGIAAHAAFPEGSESAELKLAEFLLELEVLDREGAGLMEGVKTFFSDYYGAGLDIPYEDEASGKLTHVGGMAEYDGETFRQNINIRYNVTAVYDDMVAAMTKKLEASDFHITRIHNSNPCFTDPDSTQVQKLLQICGKYLGEGLKPYVMGGGTYARRLRHGVGFGPGIPGKKKLFGDERGGAHQPDEYVEIAHLKKAVVIYADAIKALDNE